MPTNTLLLVIAVCAVFLLFAVVLAWFDHSTTKWLRAKAAEKQTAAEPELLKRAA